MDISFENFPVPLVLLDLNGNIIQINKSADEQFQHPKDDLQTILTDKFISEIKKSLLSTSKEEKIVRNVIGNKKSFKITISRDKDGFLLVFQDISDIYKKQKLPELIDKLSNIKGIKRMKRIKF